MGRPRASAIAPFVRSEAQARVLSAVLLSNDSLHIRALADRVRLPYSVVHREVDRLEESGILQSQRFGSARVVRANDQHPFYPELRALLLKAYGPLHVISDLLAGLPGVDQAFIFGSWAARYSGDWGAAPADVDVLLVGSPDRERIEEIQAHAEDRLGLPVQVTVVAQGAWDKRSSGFVRTVRRRPLVEVDLAP